MYEDVILTMPYICDAAEGYEKRGDNNEEGEHLSVLVEEFELIN